MNAGSILFAVCSVLCVAGALVVILSRNPIRGALGLLTTIVGIAGLFLRLNAQFLAAMQLLVYAGAVVILFVFVIMLLGPSSHTKESSGNHSMVTRILAGLLMAFVGVGALSLFGTGPLTAFAPIDISHGSVASIGRLIFNEALIPFELVTVLLIVAVVGAIAVARTHPNSAKKPFVENPTLRMYHGPLYSRDAEQPLGPETMQERVASASAAEKEPVP